MARRLIKRKSAVKVSRIEGSIVDTTNIKDKKKNTYSANVIEKLIEDGGKIPENYSYSVEAPGGDIDSLAAFTSGKPGITGSISLTKKASGTGSEIPAGWYHFIFTPHRTGINPIGGGDNTDYGTIILTPLNFSGASWIVRRSGSKTAIAEAKKISTLSYSDFVVQAHSVHANYISAGQSNTFSATITNAGYYPLAIAAPASYSHTNAGFTVNPLRITSRGNGTGTIQYWARNDANGATNWTNANIDVLWVKM